MKSQLAEVLLEFSSTSRWQQTLTYAGERHLNEWMALMGYCRPLGAAFQLTCVKALFGLLASVPVGTLKLCP
jgi:hypothetical protein